MGTLLAGKAGLVTGAAGGIGRGAALELAGEGASVLVSDLEDARTGGEETVRLIEREGGVARFLPCDVTDSAATAALVTAVVERYGRLDFAVNNAGVADHKALAEFSEDDYDRIVGVNLKGTFFGMKAQLGRMAAQGGVRSSTSDPSPVCAPCRTSASTPRASTAFSV